MRDAAERPYRVTAADGIGLAAWVASPPAPRAVLLLCHGLTTDAREHGSFIALRNWGLRAGLAVVRFDFRAHGRSEGTNEKLSLAGERLDVEAALELIDAELPKDVPLVPLGVSFGGAAAVHAAVTRPAAGLVLWYAVVDYEQNFGPESRAPATHQFRAAAHPNRDPPWSAMPVVGTEYFFPRTLLAEMSTDSTLAALHSLEIPVLGYYGARDKFIDVEPLRQLAAEHSMVDLRIARGAGHGFLLWLPWVIWRTVAWAARVASAKP